MSITAIQAANLFIQKSLDNGGALTQMQVQKLIYFLHGWGYPLCNRRLIADDVEAWPYGTFYRNVWQKLRQWEARPITETIEDVEDATLDSDASSLLDTIYKEFGKYSGAQLSAMTHEEGTPWHDVYVVHKKRKAVIPEELLRRHFMDIHKNYQATHGR